MQSKRFYDFLMKMKNSCTVVVIFYVKTFPSAFLGFLLKEIEKKNEIRHASERFGGNFSVLLSSEFEFYFIFSYAWFEFLWGNSTPHEVTIK